MNICVISHSFLPRIGGMEWVVHNLANALSILGHNVIVLTKKINEKDLDVKKLYRVEKFGFVFRGATKIGFDFVSFMYTMEKIYKKYKIDVINFHSAAYSGTYAIKYKKLISRNIPIVGTLHGGDIQIMSEINYGYCLDRKWRKRIINVLENSDGIICISESIRNQISNLLQEAINKVYHVPNGIWLDEFSNHKISVDIRARFGLPVNAKIVVSVGRNHIKKGFEYGIKAMNIISKKFLNVYYVIIGRDTDKLIQIINELGLNHRIVLAGEIKDRKDLLDCYLSSDIYLSPSLIEGFALTNLEAMASGLPCVITDVEGNRDVVKNNCAILVPPKSPERIAEAIIKILTNQNLKNQLKQRALDEIKKYDWIEVAKKYIEVYNNVIK